MSKTKKNICDKRRITMDETTKKYSEMLYRKNITRAAEQDLKLLNKFNFFKQTKKKTA